MSLFKNKERNTTEMKFENEDMSLKERVEDLEKAVKEQCETIKNLMDIVKIISGIEEEE